MSEDFGSGSLLDEEFEKTPSLSFNDAAVGQKIIARIAELPTKKVQRKDYDTKELLFWPLLPGQEAQKPKQNTFTKLVILDGSDVWTKDTEGGDDDPAFEIGESYNWWTNLPSQGWNEFKLKNKLLGQTPKDPGAYRTKFSVRKDEVIVLGPEYDKYRFDLNRSFRVGDVIELKLADKVKIKGKKPQNIFQITWLRSEAPAEPSLFEED